MQKQTGSRSSKDRSDQWATLLTSIRKKVNRKSFETWFKPTQLASSTDAELCVQVPNNLFREWLISNYGTLIQETAHEENIQKTVTFICPDEPQAAALQSVPERPATPPRPRVELNKKYSFDNFVVASSNQFAHAAALAVAESLLAYNPLYLYGGVGLGKTHLMHAIGHRLLETRPDLRLSYLSAEKFLNEMIAALSHKKILDFRAKYRSIDVLLLDDIQFIQGKSGTQEEIFHTFNTLYENQKQIVITSDCAPKEIPDLEERLRSRFEWGLIADIQPPDLETRMAILKKKGEMDSIHLDDEVVDFIARRVKSNIRELEGCLIRVVAHSNLLGKPITLNFAKETLKDILSWDENPVTIDKIQRLVAEHFGLKLNDLKSKNNSPRIALPRQIGMFLSKELTESSYPEIGKKFGGKHHTTVIHSYRKIKKLMEEDQNLHKTVHTLTEALK